MEDFEKQSGISFFVIYFSHYKKYYYLSFKEAKYFWNRKEEGGRKSFKIDELTPSMFFTEKKGILVPYLDMINKDLESREN